MAQPVDALWLYAAAGLSLGCYLLLLDARESLSRLADVVPWASQIRLQIAAIAFGQIAVTLALVVPATSLLIVVVGAGVAAASLFWWLVEAHADSLKDGDADPRPVRRGL